jgi:two-component system response regulator YesN
MINVLVVEDEPPIQRMICKTISEMDREFSVRYTAFNGIQAQRILEAEEVDVVFTDIMMIGGDGITLLQYLHEYRPEIQTVVLSGYDKFEYAKQAYKNGVTDYLLKPVNKTELRDILEVLKNRRQECFKNLLDGSEILQKSCFYDELQASSWYLLLIRMRSRGCVKGGMNPEFQKNIESGLVKMFGNEDTVFQTSDGAGEYVVAVKDSITDVEAKALELLNTVGQSDGVIAIAGLPEPVRVQDFRQYVLELRIQIMTESIYGKSCYSCGGRFCPPHDDTWEKDVKTEAFSVMVKALKAGDTRGACSQLDAFMREFEEKNKTCMAIENFMMEFLERGKGSSHSVRASVWNAVYETFSYGELKTRVFQLVERMNGQEEELAEDGSSEGAMPQMVVMIEQYLVDNYQRNIRAGELSMEFGFVSEYISRIFKKYVGLSPSRYLTKIRMEKACQLIKNHPEIQVKEVADQVGYKDIHYFSKVFRKEMGVWPSEYK